MREVVFSTGNRSGVDLALNEAEQNFTRATDCATKWTHVSATATFGLGQVAFQRAQRQLIPPG